MAFARKKHPVSFFSGIRRQCCYYRCCGCIFWKRSHMFWKHCWGFFDATKKWTVILPCVDSCYSNIKLLFIYYNIFLGIFKSKIYALGFFIRSTDEKSLIGSINVNKTM